MRLNPKCRLNYVCLCVCVSGLSLEQVDILWHCLVEDSECYDDALHWFLNQVRSKDQHAMGMETYKHLFLEKVSSLASSPRRHTTPVLIHGETKKKGNIFVYSDDFSGIEADLFINLTKTHPFILLCL